MILNTKVSETNPENYLHYLDPRTGLFYVTTMSLMFIISTNIIVLLILLIIASYIAIKIDSIRDVITYLLSLKYFITLFIAFFIIFSADFQFMILGQILIKIFGFLLVFRFFNVLVTPDELFDALVKIGFSSSFAWKITLSLRQTIFFVDEFQDIRKLQSKRLLLLEDRKLVRLQRSIAMSVTTIYSLAVTRSVELSNTIIMRRLANPNRDIFLHSSRFTMSDFRFFTTYSICLLTILLVSSQLFIR